MLLNFHIHRNTMMIFSFVFEYKSPLTLENISKSTKQSVLQTDASQNPFGCFNQDFFSNSRKLTFLKFQELLKKKKTLTAIRQTLI